MRYTNTKWAAWLIGLICVMVLLLSSCSNDFYCSKCVTHTVEKTVIHDTTVARDTIIKIEERTITLVDTVPCDDFTLNKDSGGVKVTVLVKDKIIYIKATCAALELKLKLYDKVRTITKTTELTHFVPSKKKCNWWIWLLIGTGLGIALANWNKIIPLIRKLVVGI